MFNFALLAPLVKLIQASNIELTIYWIGLKLGSKWPMFLKWLTCKPPCSEKATQLPTLPVWPRRRARRSVNTGDGSSPWRSRLQTSPLVAPESGELSFWTVTFQRSKSICVKKLFLTLANYIQYWKDIFWSWKIVYVGMGRLPPRKMPSLKPLRQPTWASAHTLLHKLIQALLLWRFYNLIFNFTDKTTNRVPTTAVRRLLY